MIRVAVHEGVDFEAMAPRWRDLEARSRCSFFLSWTWTGCLIAERFPDPILVEAIEDGRTVALALFNRRRRWGVPVLFLHESGDRALDCPYIEQNGVLAEAGRETELARLCLGAVLRRWHAVLSGVDATTFEAVRSLRVPMHVKRSQASLYLDLAGLRTTGRGYLGSRSANTRQQIARSVRWYAAEAGSGPAEPVVSEAATVEAAWTGLDALAALHQASWNARGVGGSFSQPFFLRFHRALIERGLPLGQIRLQTVSVAGLTLGRLYNFQYRNRILAYQSGFRYRQDVSAARPGLVSHSAAIARAMGDAVDSYDLLAGDDRYKRSLADAEYRLWWLVTGPGWSALPRALTWRRNGRISKNVVILSYIFRTLRMWRQRYSRRHKDSWRKRH